MIGTLLAIPLVSIPLSQAEVETGPDAAADAERLAGYLMIEIEPGSLEIDAQHVSNIFGAPIVDQIEGREIYKFRFAGPQAHELLPEAVTFLDDYVDVVAEIESDAHSPETSACDSITAPVQSQQCTIAFVDASGENTDGKFSDQDLSAMLGVEAAQAASQHFTPIVAVIDTGIDLDNPFFAENLYSIGYDFVLDQDGAADVADNIDNDLDGLVDEAYGHGSHVSSTVLLIAPDAQLLPLRVLDNEGNGVSFNVAKAIYRAIDEGAHLINLSLSLAQPSGVVSAALTAASEAGIAVFTSSGNTSAGYSSWPASLDLDAPNDYPAVVGVASVGTSLVLSPFSAWGPDVDLVTPGEEVYGLLYGDTWGWWSGTSMSAAIATGSAALMLSIDATNAPFDAVHALLQMGTSVDPANPAYAGELGFGIPHLPTAGAFFVTL